MSYSTENFVRRAVVGLFRGEYAGKFLCSGCLITLTHRHMQRGWRKSEIERSMEAVFSLQSLLRACRRRSVPSARRRRRASVRFVHDFTYVVR